MSSILKGFIVNCLRCRSSPLCYPCHAVSGMSVVISSFLYFLYFVSMSFQSDNYPGVVLRVKAFLAASLQDVVGVAREVPDLVI